MIDDERRLQDFRLGGGASPLVPHPKSKTMRVWSTFSQKGLNYQKIQTKIVFVSLRGPVLGLKGPILSPKGPIWGPKGHIPGLRRPISGLKRTIPCLRVHLRPGRPISGLRRSFASLRRSNLGLRSNSVHSSLRRVYSRPESIDFRSENLSVPPLGRRKFFSCMMD